MKTLVYSQDEKYYYVKELACPFCNWISIEKYKELPEQHPMKLDFAIQYDNSYFRKILPFNFWKVKSGKSVQASDDDELIHDYYNCGKHKEI